MANLTRDQLRKEIKLLIANLTEREEDEISDSADFVEELGLDSLTAMELMIAVDKKFKIDIPEDEFNKARNVNDSVAMVEHWLAARDSAANG